MVSKMAKQTIARTKTNALLSPPSSTSSGSCPPTPQLQADTIDTSPFSVCFSGWFDDEPFLSPDPTYSQNMTPSTLPRDDTFSFNRDMSYDIKNITDMRDINPDWDPQIDEIMVLSPKHKTKVPALHEDDALARRRKKCVSISDFERLRDLSCQSSGLFTLTQKRDDNQVYALKTFQRTADERSSPSEYPFIKSIQRLSSPFLPKVRWDLQDPDCLYLVLDFCPGGSLSTHININRQLHPDRAHFYASEIVGALAALHSLGIVYRKLNPGNIMLNAQGHVVLFDFSNAEFMKNTNVPHTQPMRGGKSTLEYLAPEVLLGWVHDLSVDCWSFGVLLYVMLFGRHPFVSDTDGADEEAIRSGIVNGSAPFEPPDGMAIVARDLINKCLERNSSLRFNVQDIQRHAYFHGVNWENMKTKTTTAPWIPELDETKLDLRYFDPATSGSSTKSITATLVEETAIPLPDQLHDGVGDQMDSFQLRDSTELEVVSSDLVAHAPAVQRMLQPRPHLLMTRRRTSHISCLDTVEEAGNEDSCDEALSSTNIQDSIAVQESLEEQVREQVAKNRASFWDNLSDVNSLSSSRSLDLKAGLGLSSPGLLRLRKSKSATLLEAFTASSRKKAQIASSPVVPELDLDLPKGITQKGRGIGFTYALNTAARSNTSICSTTPRACHSISLRRLFASFGRKKKQQMILPLESPISAYDDEEQGAADIMMEFGVSAKDPCGPTTNETSISPQLLNTGLRPHSYVPSFDMSREVVADDPDATLRLVSSSKRLSTS